MYKLLSKSSKTYILNWVKIPIAQVSVNIILLISTHEISLFPIVPYQIMQQKSENAF